MKVYNVEIDMPAEGPGFLVKIDGVEFPTTCGVKVESPMLSGFPRTLVTITIPANVKIKGVAQVIEKQG